MAGPRALGIIEGIAEASASLLKLVSGILADRLHRTKPLIVFGYSLAAISRPLMALANSWGMVLLLRFTDRVGKGLRSSPRDALLAQSVGDQQRGLVFGFHRAMDNLGSVIGPLLAAGLLAWGVSIKSIFAWAIIPGVLTIILACALREPPATVKKMPLETKVATFNWQWWAMPQTLRRYLILVGLFTLGNSSNLFLLLRAQELGITPVQIPLLWALVSLIAAVASTPLASLSDRFGRKRFIVSGWSIYAAFYLVLGWLPLTQLSIYFVFAGFGLFFAATEGVEKALVADLAPQNKTGTAFGWFNLIAGIMLLPASLIFGEIYQRMGASLAFTFSAVCAGSAALIFLISPAFKIHKTN